ncbi:transcription factor bHLH130 isoform X1 [Lactuca sativa]|uniref:BHLH domain-containing protein n=1 Tax=Lactuca sativa TaxID=4236 RepID=A0A9R1XR94_LACSA|nr:transcription factor bHLH130 isoform X1 [Lactuca sativa]XP_023751476.1 transcription factor bHLH130 isoform X1 [Lactuca sativa]XP_023751477.1 transcription factor bHLH130 isoform X1 [Lactuca sativa]KAJ0222816.1 hypothetical protein LSAT_V11C200087160 [Lactuca sativa]
MDSDLHNQRQQQQQKLQQQQQGQQTMNSGLTRYRSAPSSYFSNLINSGMYEDEDVDPFFNPRSSSPETERILSRLISGDGDNSSSHQNIGQIRGNDPPFMDPMKQERANFTYQSQQQQMMYQNHQQADHNHNSVVSGSSSALVDPLAAMNPPTNLLRQSSSPAGFFEHVNMGNGYSAMRSMDKFRTDDGSVPDLSKGFENRMAFSSVSHSSSRPLSLIPENEGKTMGMSGAGAHNNGGFGQTHPRSSGYGFPGGSWDEPAMLTDEFMKELGESDQISSTENQQNDERRIHASSGLSHQLSLPTSSSELSVMEKLLQFQDNVPLRSRAKRGCATHPRSIAERVRRTRISERMRKLQELVPNMDKQTNTADMLDLAVDYIKELQKQVEKLSDHHAKCTCPNKQEI